MLGAVSYWAAVVRSVRPSIFYAYCCLCSAVFLVQAGPSLPVALHTLLAVVAALFIYTAAKRARLSTWLTSRSLLLLGTISYSLYLFHGIVGERVVLLLRHKLLPALAIHDYTAMHAIILLVVGLIAAVAFSYSVYKVVEVPSVLLSKRIRPSHSGSLFSDIFRGRS
jgi:peptidoglycan/LPS O-acetylase OafA/YrhL